MILSSEQRWPSAEALLRSCPDTPGLYLHVPFCSSLCPYCPYNKVLHEPGRVRRYFEALSAEVDAYLDAAERPFTSLYVGGGTPSLCSQQLAPLVARLPVSGERAMELLPAHVTAPMVARLRELGFTFVSVGVQSFDEPTLRHLGRRGDRDSHRRAVALAMEHFDVVDVDLIFDVAFADAAAFLDDLELCLRMGVHQVSTYPLIRFGYTPFGGPAHTARREHALLRRAEALAESLGYERRSVWTFNRRDAPTYTSITRELYVGLGAGAASYTGRWFTANHFSPERYAEALGRGRLPLARAWRLPKELAILYWGFWQLYVGVVDQDRLEALFGGSGVLIGALRALERLGWVQRQHQRWVLTPAGRDRYHDLERWVTARFIEPLWADLMREHAAVDQPPGLQPPTLTARLQRRVPFLPAWTATPRP